MQVLVESVGKLGRRVIVRLPADQLDGAVNSRIQELTRTARIKGFRPGKVPLKVIEQRFGAQVRNDALSDMIGRSFQQAVEQEQLRPAVQPSISTTGRPDNGEIEYTATFDVLPEVGAIDVASLEIVRPVAEVTDADIDQMIETLRIQRRSWSPVERAAAIGDMVLFEYSVEADGVRHPVTGRDRVGTIVGSAAMSSEIEDKLTGLAADGEVEFDATLPADFRVAEVAGKQTHISIHVMRVQEPTLPDVGDAFIASFGVSAGGLPKFREDVRSNLERELRSVLMGRLKASTIEKLVAAFPDLEVPPTMVAAEAQQLAQQATQQANADPQSAGAPAATPDAYMPAARRRVLAGILLGELARQNDVRLDSRRVSEALATIASTYEEPEKVVELYTRDPQLMNSLQSRVVEDQVVEWIADHAKVNEQVLTFNELMRPGS